MKTWWIFKGSSNFCQKLEYDYELNKDVKARPDGFYDIVSDTDTVQGGIEVVALADVAAYMTLAPNHLPPYDKFLDRLWQFRSACMALSLSGTVQKITVSPELYFPLRSWAPTVPNFSTELRGGRDLYIFGIKIEQGAP